jgi:serine/threonine protein kinase
VNDLQAELQSRAEKRVGSTLRRGKYTLERLLGVGSTGAVFAGKHRNGSCVALKILHSELARVEPLKERFLREGYLANRVRHSGVVRVLDDDVDDDGSTFLVLELLDGMTVARMLREAGGQVPLVRVGAILDGILDVLEAMHADGITHCDIKPEKVFLTRDGLKLRDLGIARLGDLHGKSTDMGTLEFVAPEQAGWPARIDARTDLYSVGALGYALLAGHDAREGSDAREAATSVEPRPARSLFDVWQTAPPLFANVIDVALSFEQERRWPSASAMRMALHTALSECGPVDPPSVSMRVSSRPSWDPVAPATPLFFDGSLPLSERAAEPLPLVRPSRRGPT